MPSDMPPSIAPAAPPHPSQEKPRWLRDLTRFLSLRSQFVLSGSVRDLQTHEVAGGQITAVPLVTLLADQLRFRCYERIVIFSHASGFSALPLPGTPSSAGEEVLRALGLMPANGIAPGGIDILSATLERFVALDGSPAVLVIDFASRLLVRHDSLSPSEHQLFTRALTLSHSAKARPVIVGESRQPFFNTILWIVDKEGDLPDWFLVGNPRIRHIPVARPDHRARRSLALSLLRSLGGGRSASEADLDKAVTAGTKAGGRAACALPASR